MRTLRLLRSILTWTFNTLPVCMTKVIQEQNGDELIMNKPVSTWTSNAQEAP
jgi:hypothetical protein